MKVEIIAKLHKYFQKIGRETLSNLFKETGITLLPKPDKNITIKKITDQHSLFYVIILYKTLAKWIQQYIKLVIHHDQVRVTLGM